MRQYTVWGCVWRWNLAIAVMFSVLAGSTIVWADEGGDELRREIAALKERLGRLEAKLTERTVASAASSVSSDGAAGLPPVLQGLQISGSVDTSYEYNFNGPKSRTNTLRVFDTGANEFALHQVELNIEKPVSHESRIGWRFDPVFGEDAEVFDAAGLGTGDDEFDIQQAYVQALFGDESVDVRFGKFVTLHGAEVIESKDNWNFTRSLLFGYAIPFTHTGIRAHSKLADGVEGYIGVSNGWDVVDDNNQGKSLEAMLLLTPSDQLWMSAAVMYGPEQAGDNHDQRSLLDLVAGYTPNDQWAFKFNYDYGFEEDAVSETGKNASWQGLAGYARYAVSDRWALALRSEYFMDYDGVRTGLGRSDLRIWEMTLTSEVKLHEHLIARLEYRHDEADEDVYPTDGSPSSGQDTIGLELITPF